MMLVTIAQASAHCRRDTTEDDSDFEMKIEAASEMVMDYISDNAKDAWTDSTGLPYEDSDGVALDVPRRIQAATLTLIDHLYMKRNGETDDKVPAEYGYGYLPMGVTMLLYSLRKPTVV